MGELLRGRYELIEVVGQGGEGRVLKALDTQLDRIVALKIRDMRLQRSRDELLAEARVLLNVPPHPRLPLVREDFFDAESYVIAMDWVEGTSLAQLLRARGNPGMAPSLVMQWMADAAAALTHLHTQPTPVIHGDIKPANLVLTTGGRVSLVDFGLSSTPSAPQRRGGTPGYTAPEVSAEGVYGRASDVYALAATAFTLLTGEVPTGVRPSWDGIAAEEAAALEDAIRAAMTTDPARRTKTPGEFVERLRAGWGATLPSGVLTFCLTDIEGSTALWERDPVAMAEALVAHDAVIASAAESHGGRFLKSMGEGDATVSVFGSPRAAVDAAIAMARELALPARIALHTGEAEHRDDDYFGPTLNLAARLRGLGAGGQIFMSAATASLVRGQLPADASLVDLGAHHLKGIEAPETVFALKAEGVQAPPPPECPYPGLLAFETGDAARFFGREAVVADVVARLDRGFVAVIGASGSGKSSLLRAGVAARVTATVITPGPRPALPDAAGLLIVDQFEELFTLCDDDRQRHAFVDALLARTAPVAIALRADFYGPCATHAGLAAALSDNQVLLGPMTDADLQRAIVAPAVAAGLSIEPGLVDLIVEELAGESGALPLLSHALRATWEVRNGRTLTLEGYRATGGVRGAIARSADALLAECDEAERAAARRIFLRLTKPGDGTEDTRRRVARAELPDDDGVTDRVLSRLAAARLVTLDDAAVDVAHEALIREWPTLRAWLDEDRDGLRVRQHLADAALSWDRGGRMPSDVYRGARLAAVEGLGELGAVERDFVAASTRQQNREVRVLRGVLGAVAVALVIALVAGALAFVSRNNASTNARRANVSRLAALSRAVRAKQPDLGLLLAVEAFALQDSAETRGALVGALGQNPRLVGELHGIDSGLENAAFSPDGRILATATFDGTLLWDTVTRKRIGAPLKDEQHVWESAAFNPDGTKLAIVGDLGIVSVWDVATRKVVQRMRDPDDAYAGRVAWSPNGAYIVTGGGDGDRVVAYDATTGAIVGGPASVAPPNLCAVPTPAFTPDSATLVVSGDCGSVHLLRLPALERLATVPVTSDPTATTFAVAVAKDSPIAAVAAQTGEVVLIDVATRSPVGSPFSVGDTPALSVALTPDGSRLAAGSAEGKTFVWDVPTRTLYGEPLSGNSGRINGVAFSPDGRTLATASYDRRGAIWDLAGRQPLGVPLGEDAWITSAAFSRDGRLLASGFVGDNQGTSGGVLIRSAKTLAEVARVELPAAVLDVAFAPRGHELALSTSDGRVVFVDADTGAQLERTVDLGKPGWVSRLAFDDDGRLAVATAPNPAVGFPDPPANGVVHIFDKDLQPAGKPIAPRAGDVTDIAFGGNRLLVVGEQQGAVFDLQTRRRIGPPLRITDTSLYAAAITRDGKRVAFGGFSGKIEMREGDAHAQAAPALAADPLVIGARFTRDQSLLVTNTVYGHTQLWDAGTGEAVGDALVGGRVPVPSSRFFDFLFPARAAVSPDGRQLATGGVDGSGMLWDIAVDTWSQRACSLAGRALTRVEWERYVGDRAYRPTCR